MSPQDAMIEIAAEAHVKGLRSEKVTPEDIDRWLDTLHSATTQLAVEAFIAGFDKAREEAGRV